MAESRQNLRKNSEDLQNLGARDEGLLDLLANIVGLDSRLDADLAALLEDLVLITRVGEVPDRPLVDDDIVVLIAEDLDREVTILGLEAELSFERQEPVTALLHAADPLGTRVALLALLNLLVVTIFASDRLLCDLGERLRKLAMLMAREPEIPMKVVKKILGRIDRPESVTAIIVVRDLAEVLDHGGEGLVPVNRLPEFGATNGIGLVLAPEIVCALEFEALDAGVTEDDIIAILMGEHIPTGQKLPTMGAAVDLEPGCPDLSDDLPIKGIKSPDIADGADLAVVDARHERVLARLPVPRETVLRDAGGGVAVAGDGGVVLDHVRRFAHTMGEVKKEKRQNLFFWRHSQKKRPTARYGGPRGI